jgi:hypothetical protein
MKPWKSQEKKKKFEPYVLTNGDTLKQLLARSRYFLYKNKSKWSKTKQNEPQYYLNCILTFKKAYDLAQDLRNIFEKTTDKIIGLQIGDGMKSKSIRI